MARWLTVAVAVGTVIPCVSPAPSAAATAARCGPTKARTLAASSGARVYAQGNVAYACAASNGRRVGLGMTGVCGVGPFASGGDLVAYAAESCGIDFGTSTVVVLRPSDRRELLSRSALVGNGTGVESHVTVGSLVVNRSGAAAWIMVDRSAGSVLTMLRVIEDHGRSVRVLAAGLKIDPRSLRLHGAKLTWRAGGATHSAKFF